MVGVECERGGPPLDGAQGETPVGEPLVVPVLLADFRPAVHARPTDEVQVNLVREHAAQPVGLKRLP